MPVTVQVLDVVHGRPAADLGVRLERSDGTTWAEVARATTDERGRIEDWGGADRCGQALRLILDARRFFAVLGMRAAQADITIALGPVGPGVDRHVPVLMGPFGYSTYLGVVS